jgi:spore germination protein GerM
VNRIAVIVLGAVFVAGCGIDTDSGPRPINPDALAPAIIDPVDVEPGGAGAPPTADVTQVYLVAPDPQGGQQLVLQAVPRSTADSAAGALAALFRGPSSSELAARLRSAIPADVQLRGIGRRGSTLLVDAGAGLETITGGELQQAVAQIVYTATAVEGIEGVLITVDGVSREWPAGNGELQARPLTRYDFPGVLPSAQPAFPAIPSRDDG